MEMSLMQFAGLVVGTGGMSSCGPRDGTELRLSWLERCG